MTARRLLMFVALYPTAFAGNTSWCLNIVDDTEAPVSNVQVFWRDADYPDWCPVQGMTALGNGRDGGGFQTIGETLSNLDNNDRVPQAFFRLLLDYYFETYARSAHGHLKIAHPDYQPVEMQVPFPNNYKWDHVEMRRREEGRGSGHCGSREQDRMPDVMVLLQVLAENDQRTLRDDTPLPGAQVTVTMEASGRTYRAEADGGGNISLPVPEPGRATIEVSCGGYRQYHWRTALESGRTESQRITLSVVRIKR